LLFNFHIFEHKPITGLQSETVHYSTCQSVRGYINIPFFYYYWSMNTSLAVALHLVACFAASLHK